MPSQTCVVAFCRNRKGIKHDVHFELKCIILGTKRLQKDATLTLLLPIGMQF